MKQGMLVAIILSLCVGILPALDFYEPLSEAQRYDLADAYMKVSDQYAHLEEAEKASAFKEMVEKIYPGFDTNIRKPASSSSVPAMNSQPTKTQEAKTVSLVDPAGKAAALYYMKKFIRGVFNEDVNLSISVVGDILFLPAHDAGLKRRDVQIGLESIFDQYDFQNLNSEEVFDMESVVVSPKEDGYWMVKISPREEYLDFFSNLDIWSEAIGFYFHEFPQGWRLGAIGPVL